MYLVDADQHGPAVLAIHRLLADVDGAAVLAGLEGDFDARPAGSPAEVEQALAGLPADAVAFGLYAGGRSWLLTARDPAALAAEAGRDRRMLDVEVLHGPVLSKRLGVSDFEGRVVYESDLPAATSAVDRGAAASLLIVRPAPFATVAEIAAGGETLPEDDVLLPEASRRPGAAPPGLRRSRECARRPAGRGHGDRHLHGRRVGDHRRLPAGR